MELKGLPAQAAPLEITPRANGPAAGYHLGMPPLRRRPRRALISALEKRYGPHSDVLLDVLHKIATGQRFEVPTDIPNVVKVLTPTISEIHAAAMDLLAYQHGRPTQSVEVDVDDRREKWNPDKLTLTELQQIDALARKANTQALAIDVPFAVLPEGDKPK